MDLTPVCVSPQPTQELVQCQNISTDEQLHTGLVYQGGIRFLTLPIELQAYILSFLDQKEFHRASLS